MTTELVNLDMNFQEHTWKACLVNRNFIKDLYPLYLGNLNVHKSQIILAFTEHYKGISSKICEFPVTYFWNIYDAIVPNKLE